MKIKVLRTKRKFIQLFMYLLFLVGLTSLVACKTCKIHHHEAAKYGPPSEEYQKK